MVNDKMFDDNHDPGRINTRIMFSRHKEISIKERRERNEYFNVYQMYCENRVIDRFRQVKDKLTDKNLMFKFDGSKYAVYSLDISDRTQLTDYVLTLEELEDFAEKYNEKGEICSDGKSEVV